MAAGEPTSINRRTLLIGGGAGVGLLVAWAVWPRSYAPNLTASKGEHIYGAWLKIGEDGHVAVAVPQAEHGQGFQGLHGSVLLQVEGQADGDVARLTGRDPVVAVGALVVLFVE